MQISTLIIIPGLLFINQIILSVHARQRIINEERKKNYNGKECAKVADFYYEIVVGVTSFPKQGDCNDREEAGIASFLERKIDEELSAVPATIRTKNKLCSNPINSRRRLLSTATGNGSFFDGDHDQQANGTLRTSLFRSMKPREHQNSGRILHRTGLRRSFIYVGGGKCRYCLNDNFDHRTLAKEGTPKLMTLSTDERNSSRRDLMFLKIRKPIKPLKKVADILLCKDSMPFTIRFRPALKREYQENYTNAKRTALFDKALNRNVFTELIGHYKGGESFGVQLDMNHAVNVQNNRNKQLMGVPMVELPVKRGTIGFVLFAFDLPEGFTRGILPDDPLILFINGIKLDFNLLMSQPDAKKTQRSGYEKIEGKSFAGIEWQIKRIFRDEDFSHGPQPDREYRFQITAPLVVLSHKNQLDLDFMIKPTAKAKQYAFRNLHAYFWAAECQVTGLENSPFAEFQSVVESRLFHKLGNDLAHKFQSKKGHCLQDKIPVVNVNLVEKEDWKYSNPQC